MQPNDVPDFEVIAAPDFLRSGVEDPECEDEFPGVPRTASEILGPEGILSRHLRGYKARPQQLELAEAVERAIREGQQLVAHAPTGVGKSQGYLAPAAILARRQDLRVMISTSTLTLQAQLLEKELPAVAAMVPGITFGVLKGISNYLCRRKLETPELQVLPDREIRELQEWSRHTQFGDVAELPWQPSKEAWSKVSTDSSSCRGRNCAAASRCFARSARQRAMKATFTVTNHAMLLRACARGSKNLLSSYDVLVVDEAHELADVARDAFGFRLTAARFRHAARHLPTQGAGAHLRDDVSVAADRFFDYLKDEVMAQRKNRHCKERIVSPGCVGAEGRIDDLERVLKELISTYVEMTAAARGDLERQTDLHNAQAQAELLVHELGLIRDLDRSWVFYLEESRGKKPALCASLLDPSDVLESLIWRQVRASVLTSATLVDGDPKDPFDLVIRETGCYEDVVRLRVESPFDFASNAVLHVPPARALPDIKSEKFPEAAASYILQLIEVAGGSVLCLFTSFRMLEAARHGIAGKVRHRVLCQGEASRDHLVEQFRGDESSVLLGTMASFGAGVDVPGPALRMVVMDRIPFPSPSSPIVDALGERDDDSFDTYSVPLAVRDFQQGFGRLIRREDDHGVVVLLDRRIVTKRYGAHFREAIPRGVKITDDIGALEAYLRRRR